MQTACRLHLLSAHQFPTISVERRAFSQPRPVRIGNRANSADYVPQSRILEWQSPMLGWLRRIIAILVQRTRRSRRSDDIDGSGNVEGEDSRTVRAMLLIAVTARALTLESQRIRREARRVICATLFSMVREV